MPLLPMLQFGPYIPFEKPIPVLPSLSDDDPLLHACFNSSWLPLVVGALKVLCRPETWDGTDAEIRLAMSSAHDLIASISDGCDFQPLHPNWYLDLDIDYANYDVEAWVNPVVGLYGDGTPWFKYTLVVWGTGFGGGHLTVVGRDWDTGDLVGGRFDNVLVSNQLDPAGQTYVLTTLDCLDNTVVNSDFTPRSYSGDYKHLEFITGNISVYIMKFLISGDWLCTAT